MKRLIASAVVAASAAGISLIGAAPAHAGQSSSTNSFVSPPCGIHYAYLLAHGYHANGSSAVSNYGTNCIQG